jgi:hypothetical protein
VRPAPKGDGAIGSAWVGGTNLGYDFRWEDPAAVAVYDACRGVGDQVGREVNLTIMTADELAGHSGFPTQIRRSPVVPVVGELPPAAHPPVRP